MADAPLVVYGIRNCDTVRKARAWLAEHGIESRFHDLGKNSVPGDRLAAWFDAVGWQAVLNRRGTTWRKLGAAGQGAVVDAASAAQALSASPSLVKRPVVEWPDGTVTVGFDAEAWSAR